MTFGFRFYGISFIMSLKQYLIACTVRLHIMLQEINYLVFFHYMLLYNKILPRALLYFVSLDIPSTKKFWYNTMADQKTR